MKKAQGKHEKTINTYCDRVYTVCYIAGIRFLRCLHTLSRITRLIRRPIAYAVSRFFHSVTHPSKTRIITALNYGLPLTAGIVCFLTVRFWVGSEFAMALEYNGVPVGYIANETDFNNAIHRLEKTVINETGKFSVERMPQVSLARLGDNTILSEQDIYNQLTYIVRGQVRKGFGLYIDDEFKGALSTRQDLENRMQEVLKDYPLGHADEAAFYGNVRIVEGMYPTEDVIDPDAMEALLRLLPIQTMKNHTYTETVPYATRYRENTDQPLGYRSVTQSGVNGKQRVVSQTVYLEGEEIDTVIVSTEILKEAKDEIIMVGMQKYSDESILGDGKATGRFIWPLPYTKQISSRFASRWGSFHGAIDIANGSTKGKPIIASDGGVVVEAGLHGSYGYYVLIDHQNGFKTRYAHCSTLEVEVGQKVAQGEYIAKVGNTGYSFGYHLHFEIIKDGVLVDPLLYVER